LLAIFLIFFFLSPFYNLFAYLFMRYFFGGAIFLWRRGAGGEAK